MPTNWGARNFSGGNVTASLPTALNAYGGPLTAALWGNPTTVSANSGTMVQLTDTNLSNRGFWLILSSFNLGTTSSHWGGGFAGQAYLDSGQTLTAGTWTHLAMTKDGAGAWALLQNGAQVQSGGGGYGVLNTTTDLYKFLSGTNAGSLADFALWTVVLTALELAALVKGARPNTIRPANLISYFPLDGLQSPEPDLANYAAGTVAGATSAAFGPPFSPSTRRWPQYNAPPPQVSVAYQRAQQILMTGP